MTAATEMTGEGPRAPEPGTTIVELRGISRSFGGVHALRRVDLTLKAGEVLGLLGENGAGKSTLVKILTGVLSPDEGKIIVDGEPQKFSSSRAAREMGITATYQEPMVFPTLDVAENIFAGRLPTQRGAIQWGDVHQAARTTLDELGVALDPRTPVSQLGIADRQLIEIGKSLSIGARVLVLDEPTAVLSSREIDRLFGIVARLRERGVALMFISHKLDEIKQITDRVVVMRDGQQVAERDSAQVAVGELIRLMVGREISDLYPRRPTTPGKVMLEVKGLSRDGYFEDVSFTVRAGEILGFAGLVGAGRTEIAQSIFGIDPIDRGEILLDGLRFTPKSPRHAVNCGIAYLPENRLVHGLVPTMKVPPNMTMSIWPRLVTKLGVFRTREMNRQAAELAGRVQLQAGRLNQLVSTLSGGNQQKVVLGKWLASGPRLLILDEPTHGIDVGTKAEVLRIVAELARSGVAVMLISSELDEVRSMSTRLLVMRAGRMVGEFDCPVDSDTVMEAAAGVSGAAP
ncbi:MAG TPA: sugar ABC transporter ATP-binding protein [Solirubrobacteraceae bacterium]|nr:sugar ABC transporter ATP-binding protein [Solirubrobacteraceae bacterium]